MGFPGGSSAKEPAAGAGGGCDPCVGKILWRRAWQPTVVFLPGESHGQRSLAGYQPWDRKELDMTEATEHTTEQWPNYTVLKIRSMDFSAFM